MFRPVANNISFPKQETEVLAFWKERGIYEKSLAQRAGAPPFVFFEGPPTANGLPHPGHCLTRAIKDLFPRYRTMRGFRCERKAGWDTHGLPVEVEVCKELGIHSKEEIEEYGIEPFIQKCQQSVWRYMQEWEQLTQRLGFWVDLKDAYVTYHQSYIESVWWSLAELFKRGLLYQGYKIVWWWAQGGTALSSGEVGLGYREVADPSVYVKFPLLDDAGKETDTSLLVWTTTPWTLPSNQFAAVHPELEYSVLSAEFDGKPQRIVVAAALADAIRAKVKQDLQEVEKVKGKLLLGKRYRPPFDYYYKSLSSKKGKQRTGGEQHVAWRVVAADFVTTDSGTGVVHQAPAFGEVDYDVLIAEQSRFESGQGPQLINAVGPDGKFTSDAPDYQGRWVKDCDRDITRNLRERGLLFHQEQYLHEYPFCWRAEQDPLIQYPRRSWFIRTTQYKDAMLANNEQINWLPDHIKHGRFGNFLETNVDWALSRERYWGTPLPIWVCQQTGQMEAISSYEELLAKPGVQGTEVWAAAKQQNPALVEDLKVHKPYIDEVTYDSPFAKGARMKRVTEVIDCWYDSGAMPFAQWGYPHTNADKFRSQFPADFISEALDQTRGWFYSLLAISTLLFAEDGEGSSKSEARNPKQVPNPKSTPHSALRTPHSFPHPYRTCIVLGLMLSEWYEGPKNRPAGEKAKVFLAEDDAKQACGPGNYEFLVGKMSKQKRNYREPQQIFDMYGADALRWYFFANQAPWTSIRYSEAAIKDSIPSFLLTLWNCYGFFVNYANSHDKFNPAERISASAGQLTAKDLARGQGFRPVQQRRELDRWILSELNRTCAGVVERMDAYDNFGACKHITAFIDNLSNWYVRRSRPRFWSDEYESPDKLDAYWTLYECLTTTCKLIAPFTPFVAEAMWQNLAGVFGSRAVESVHLCDFPTGDPSLMDETLSEQMELARLGVSLGLRARMNAKIKVRQPLAKVEIILADQKHQGWLEEHRDVVADELNVEEVEFTDEPDKYINVKVDPNWKVLGPKLGKFLPKFKKWLSEQSASDLLANLRDNGKIDFDTDGQHFEIVPGELVPSISAKEGWTSANDRGVVVVLATELTPQLISKGLARELVRTVNERRKETGCQFTDQIDLAIVTDSPDLQQAIRDNSDYIKTETQAETLSGSPLAGVAGVEREIGDYAATIHLRVRKS